MTDSVNVDDRTDLCRLTVLTDRTQVDLALPAGVPLALLIPELVSMIEIHSETTVLTDRSAAAAEWVLGRLGQAPLDPAGSLATHGVRDGDLLLLHPADRRPPAPLFDDLMHNVAAIGSDTDRRWTPATARVTGSVTAVALATIGAAALLLGREHDDGLAGMLAALVTAALLVAAGAVTARVYDDGAAGVTLWGAALPPAFAAGALVVPGDLGAASVLLGAVTSGAVAILAARISGVGVTVGTASATVSVLAAGAASLAELTGLSAPAVGGITTAAALAVLAAAPRGAMLLASLPLPPVSSPGSPLDAEDADSGESGPLASFVGLEAKAARARRHLTGLVAAAGATTGAGALVAAGVLGPGGIDWPGTILAVVSAVVLMLRGRTYASLAPAAVLIACGIAIPLLLLTGAAVSAPVRAVATFVLAMLGVGVAMTLGVLAPRHEFSPVQRRAVELLDYAAVAAVLPLVCWVSGLFAAMRGL